MNILDRVKSSQVSNTSSVHRRGGEVLFGEAPYGHNEAFTYDILVDGKIQTELKYVLAMTGEGQGQKFYTVSGFLGKEEVFDSEVTFYESTYAPVSSKKVMNLGGGTVEASVAYTTHQATVHLLLPKQDRFSVPLRGAVYDNEQIVHLLRTVDFERRRAASFFYLYPFAKHVQTAFFKTIGSDTVTGDAGEFLCSAIELSVPGQRVLLWYAQNHPHPMVRYHCETHNMVLELKQYHPTVSSQRMGNPLR
ncbi:MAG: hypothetical protein JSV84_13895 [Gemmatimonadota bacterium]|nr:MAG: hypothetical protein JSV84_13895 [Gemmatimonadota bacterium]